MVHSKDETITRLRDMIANFSAKEKAVMDMTGRFLATIELEFGISGVEIVLSSVSAWLNNARENDLKSSR